MTDTDATNPNRAAAVACDGAPIAPARARAEKATSPKHNVAKTGKSVKAESRATKAKANRKFSATSPSAARSQGGSNKGEKILEMIRRPKGATLAELMKATGWQAHSVRGFISTAGKKDGVHIESIKNEDGGRVYKA
jgi:hypothetical protein